MLIYFYLHLQKEMKIELNNKGMKKQVTIEQLVNTAVKMGHNAKDVQGIIAQNFDYILRTYPTASKKEMIHIAFVIYK